MNNEDMPENPQSFSMSEQECGTTITHLTDSEAKENMGETKREKAFWQVYSAMISSPKSSQFDFDALSINAVEAVNAGFKALGENNQ